MRGETGGATRKTRVPVSLACGECQSRNYKTTKAPGSVLAIKKFCRTCKHHTAHKETK